MANVVQGFSAPLSPTFDTAKQAARENRTRDALDQAKKDNLITEQQYQKVYETPKAKPNINGLKNLIQDLQRDLKDAQRQGDTKREENLGKLIQTLTENLPETPKTQTPPDTRDSTQGFSSSQATERPVDAQSTEASDTYSSDRGQSSGGDAQKSSADVARQVKTQGQPKPGETAKPQVARTTPPPTTPPKTPPPTVKVASQPTRDPSQKPKLPGDGAVARQPGAPAPATKKPLASSGVKGATPMGEPNPSGEVVVAEAPVEPLATPEEKGPGVRIFAMAKPKAGDVSQDTQEEALAKAAMARVLLTPPSETRVPVNGDQFAKMDPPGKKADEPGKETSGDKTSVGRSGQGVRPGQLRGRYAGMIA